MRDNQLVMIRAFDNDNRVNNTTIEQQVNNQFDAILHREFHKDAKRKNKRAVNIIIKVSIRKQAAMLVQGVRDNSESDITVARYLLDPMTSKADLLIDKLRNTNSLDARAKAITLIGEAIYKIVN